MRARLLIAIATVTLGGTTARAQASDALYSRLTAMTGWELRGYTFDRGASPTFPTEAGSQWRLPVIAVAPVARRLSLDLTTSYVRSTVETAAGTETLSGLTDTQLRGLYTLSRDRLVASLALNLPTGKQDLTAGEFRVAGAIGSPYLSFPVATIGSGFSATGGVAWARPLGAWNLGVSGSFRFQGTYTPLKDSTSGVEYNPGAELRVRAGVDRLVGERTRLLLGATVSTFSTDEFSGTGQVASGRYKPGPRLIGELAVVRVVGRSTVTFVAWDYLRTAGDTNGVTDDRTSENVFNAEVRWNAPVTARLQLEPMVAFRQQGLKDFRGGRLLSGGVAARIGISDRVSANVTGRFDTGWVAGRDVGRADVTGYGLAAFLRYSR
jgi:hypothetical protein